MENEEVRSEKSRLETGNSFYLVESLGSTKPFSSHSFVVFRVLNEVQRKFGNLH